MAEARTKLTGRDLLDHFTRNAGRKTADIVQEAGYWRKNGDRITIQFTQFWNAYAAANGHQLADAKGPTVRKRGDVLKVGKKGMVPVSGAYTRDLGLEAGDYFKIEMVPEGETRSIDGPALIGFKAEAQEATPAQPNPAGIPPVLQLAS